MRFLSEEERHSELLKELGLNNFNGTVYTTYNKGSGYVPGKYGTETTNIQDIEEHVVDGEPIERYKLHHTGVLKCLLGLDPTEQNMASMRLRISQHIEIQFLNNIHEISKDYRYEVRVSAETYGECKEYFQQVSCGIHTRRDEKLVIETSSAADLIGYADSIPMIRCFHFIIRRLSTKDRNKSDDVPSIGEMLFEDEFYSDASLVVGDRIFSIHKRVLALRSDVFKSMFTHRMTENEDGIVKIDDFDAEVMEELIFYVYTGKTKNLHNILRDLFEAAHKYQIHDLEDKCKEHMVFNLNFENAVDILDLANIYDLFDLKKKILAFAKKYEREMVHQENFQNFLYRDLNLDNVASTLLLCVKYNLEELKMRVFEFLKDHKKDILEKKDFMDLFDTEASLMREIFSYLTIS